MEIKQIAEEAIRIGALSEPQERRIYHLFSQGKVDDNDLTAADQLIHLLLDGRVARESGLLLLGSASSSFSQTSGWILLSRTNQEEPFS